MWKLKSSVAYATTDTRTHDALIATIVADQGSTNAGTVAIICPGGLEHGGGIGRQMGYFLKAASQRRDGPRYRVIDSRGPWFLGASRAYAVLSLLYLARALAQLVALRLTAPRIVLHINITGRGSTVRKIVLANWASALGLRYLLHVHDYDYTAEYHSRGRLMRFLIRSIFNRAQKVLVLGQNEQQSLSAILRLRQGQAVVRHNAVPDPLPTATPADRTAGLPVHLVFLGHLSARKGVPELLRAFAHPALASRPWRATLAGGGPIDEYRALAEQLGVASRVTFPGWMDQPTVSALYAEADVLVLPSHAEGLAMAVLEGLSHGLVVITTPVGAHSEVIESGKAGLLVPPGDVAALADALAQVIDSKDLRDHLRAGARRQFLAGFEVDAYTEWLSNLHSRLLGRSGDRPCDRNGIG